MKSVWRFWLAVAVLAAVSAGWFLWQPGPARRPPNLMLVCMDAVRFDSFWLPERAGYTDSFTSWARRAIRFEDVQTVSSWTIPAVASILTGMLPEEHGAGSFESATADLNSMAPSGLAESIPTLPAILEQRGYQTIHLTFHPWTASPIYGLASRFSLVETIRQPLEPALDWMRRCDKPCFVSLHLLNVHQYGKPLEEVRKNLDAFAPELERAAREAMPRAVRDAAQEGSELWYLEYVRRVAEMRNQLAALLEGLSQLGLLDETVVVAYSDHGEEFGEHGQGGHGKSLYQETLHVPVLAWVPGVEGRTVVQSVSLADFQPTMLHWLGIDLPSPPMARNLVDGSQPAEPRPVYSSGIAYGNDAAAVRLGPWKLIYDRVSQDYLIFNLAQDPLEQQPVASPPPEIESRLLMHLETLENLQSRQPRRYPSPDQKLLERLQSLGYLSGKKQ